MTERKEKIITTDVDQDLQLLARIYRAFEHDGTLIPVSPEAVAKAEAELAEEEFELPASLASFEKAVERAGENRLINCSPLKLNSDKMDENLARAAREGGEVTAEVEAKMRADRIAAEGDADAKGQN